MRLRVLLLLMALCIAVLPLTLFWLWPHAQAVHHELDGVRDRHLVLADKVGAALRRYHRDAAATFNLMAFNLLREQPVTGADDLLRELNFRHVCLIDPKTGAVVRAFVADPDKPPAAVVPPQRLAEWLRTAHTDAATFGSVVAGPDGMPVLTVTRIVGDMLALGVVDTTYLAELGRSVSFGRRGHAVIVDDRGRALAHPIDAWAREMRDLSAIPPVGRAMKGERGIDRFYSPAFREDMVAAFAPAIGTGWSVLVPQPVSELEQAAAATHRSILIVFVLGLGIALFLAGVVSLIVLSPVRAVIVAARRRAAGDHSARVDVRHGRLLRDGAELVQSFNAMADAVDVAHVQQQAALERAEHASAAKTRFLANVSHELRTPLNAILGFTEVMLRGDGRAGTQSRRAEYLGYIHQSGTHLLALINDLLDLSKIDAGAARVDESVFPVRGVLNEAMALMRTQADAREIRMVLNDQLVEAHLRADERALRQVLLNLMANAVRYTHLGDTITVATAWSADGGIEISVSDNGPGIPASDLARVLEPFQRGTEVAARGFEGTGLGLPISRRLVELHGGSLRLESALGAGTTAVITLPASRVVAAPSADVASAA